MTAPAQGQEPLPLTDSLWVKGRGEAFEQFHASVLGVMSTWTLSNQSRTGEQPGLDAIYFDKLANVPARLLRAAPHVLRSRPGEVPSIPYEERNGRHGPGQALSTHRPNEPIARRFLISILADLQQILGSFSYFQVDSFDPDPTSPLVEPVASDYRTRVRVAGPIPQLSQAVSSLPGRAQHLIEEIALPVSQLSTDQLRAFGTHCSATGMGSVLGHQVSRFVSNANEAAKWFRLAAEGDSEEAVCAGIAHAANSGEAMLICAGEIHRKLAQNPDHYEHAFDVVDTTLQTGTDCRMVFDAVYEHREAIWAGDRVAGLATDVDPLLYGTQYVKAVADAAAATLTGSDAERRATSERLEAANERVELGGGLPRSTEDILTDAGALNTAALESVARFAESLAQGLADGG